MNNRFDGIVEFVAATRLGSFTAVAAELGITKSAVGRAVSRLEARLGSQLLYRTTRRLTLTQAGEAWLEHCRAALAELERGENALVLGRETACGEVRIDLPTAFGRLFVMPVLLDIAERYPGLLLNVSFTDRCVDLVRENIDLVVRIGRLEDSVNLVARQIAVQQMVVVGAPSYIARHGAPHNLDDLANHDCIVGKHQEQRAVWLLKEPDGSVLRHSVPIKHEIHDFEMVQAAARAGQGLTQLPYWMVKDDVRHGRLQTIFDELSGGDMPINVVWPRTETMPIKIRVVVDELVKKLSICD